MEEVMGFLEIKVKQALENIEGGSNRGNKKGKAWWDDECVERKRVVKRALRNWRKGEEEGIVYRRLKKEYKE